ncbi:hypothetical protein GJ744_003008 [Endocarpon pusillum]|uniref:Nephrocystin 3-like N-terminal domain-containing protein n=1 Tax=Endocarpon pusillum TaxID=364733 RepID=A0A8H7AA38_9EURO|nr:hypothetical protein GJ744_003008 [Endocarpon pusillum]
MPSILNKLQGKLRSNNHGKRISSSHPEARLANEAVSSSPAGRAHTTVPEGFNLADQQASGSCWDMALERLKQEHANTHEKLVEICKGGQAVLSAELIVGLALKARQLKERDGRLRRASRQAAKVITSLEKIVMPVARLDPHGGAAMACGGIFAIMQIALNDTKQYDLAFNSVMEVVPVIERWTFYEKRSLMYDQFSEVRASQNFRVGLVELYLQIMIHTTTVATYCQKSSLRRFAEAIAPNHDEWKIQLDLVKGRDETCKSYRDNHEAEKNFQKQHWDILQWICTTDPSFEHQNVLDTTKVGSDYSQSGQWFLDGDEYRRWRDAQGSNILWLRGTVGTGKTTLMARVIEDLKQFPVPQSRLAWHYCSKAQSGGKRIDQVSVLKSILRQIAWVPETTSVASPIVEIHKRLECNRPKESNLSVKNCIDLIKDIAQSAQELHAASFRIIVDAVDECEEAGKLLKSLHEATEHCNHVFLMFSSRPNVQVPSYLGAATQVHIESAKSLDDLLFFVDNDIMRRDERLPGTDPCDLEGKLFDVICGKADGMFRWAQMQLEDFLSSSASRPPLHTRTEFNDKLERLRQRTGVSDLDQEYARIYSENTIVGYESCIHAARAYKLLLCSFKPMTLNQLVSAVAMQEDGNSHPDVSGPYILDICSNFITVTRDEVQFAHASAREYLESRRVGEYEEFGHNAQHCEAALTSLYAVRHYCGELLNHAIETGQYELPCRRLPVELHFTCYAAIFWATHASKLSAAARKAKCISSEIARFLSSAALGDWGDWIWRTWGAEESRNFASITHKDNNFYVPNPVRLISVFGFVECLEMPEIACRIPDQGTNSRSPTPLHLACIYGQSAVIEKLLGCFREHVDINKDVVDCGTPLCAAIKSGTNSIEVVSLLIKHGVITTNSSEKGLKALREAVYHGHHEIVQMLLEHMKKEFTHQEVLSCLLDPKGGILWLAAKDERHYAAFEFLLAEARELGLDIANSAFKDGQGDQLGDHLLCWASIGGNNEGLNLLAELKASNGETGYGVTALGGARTTKIAEFLLRLHPSLLWATGVDGATALHKVRHRCVVELLLRHRPALLWERDNRGRTALHRARDNNIAEYLLGQDPSLVSARDAQKKTPLLTASEYLGSFFGLQAFWKMLLGSGGDINDCDATGRNILHLLVQGKSFSGDDLDFLIKKGLAGNRDHGGNTALHLLGTLQVTVLRFWLEALFRLVGAGERLLATNKAGKTAAENTIMSLLQRYAGRLFDVWIFLRRMLSRVIIQFMEELRQEEDNRLLSEEQLDKLRFLCHRLIQASHHNVKKAEERIRKDRMEGDEIILGYLQKQRECGWQLPMSKANWFNEDDKDGEGEVGGRGEVDGKGKEQCGRQAGLNV